MSMTKKDYEVVAAVVKAAREHALGSDASSDLAIRLTSAMATAFEAQNPAFNRHKFCVAAMPAKRDESHLFGVVQ